MDEYLSALGYLQSYYQNAEAYLKEKYKDEITEKKHIHEIIYPYKGTQAKYDDAQIESTSGGYLRAFTVMAWPYERPYYPDLDIKYRRFEAENPYIVRTFRSVQKLMSESKILEYKQNRWFYRIPLFFIPTFSCIVKIAYIRDSKTKREKITSWKKMFELYSKTLRDFMFKSNNGLLKFIEEEDLYSLYYINLIWAIKEIGFVDQIMNESVDDIMVKHSTDILDLELSYAARICNDYSFSFYWFYYNEKIYQSLNVINNISSQDEINGKFDYTTRNVLLKEYEDTLSSEIASAIKERVSGRIGILMNSITEIVNANLDKSKAEKIFENSKKARKKSDNSSTDSIIDTAYNDMLKRHPLYVGVELKGIKNDFQTKYKELIKKQDAIFDGAFDSYTTVEEWKRLRDEEYVEIRNIVNILWRLFLYGKSPDCRLFLDGESPDYCLFKRIIGLMPKDFDQMVHDLMVEKFKKFEDTSKRNDTPAPISKDEVQERLEVLMSQSGLYREVWNAFYLTD